MVPEPRCQGQGPGLSPQCPVQGGAPTRCGLLVGDEGTIGGSPSRLDEGLSKPRVQPGARPAATLASLRCCSGALSRGRDPPARPQRKGRASTRPRPHAVRGEVAAVAPCRRSRDPTLDLPRRPTAGGSALRACGQAGPSGRPARVTWGRGAGGRDLRALAQRLHRTGGRASTLEAGA